MSRGNLGETGGKKEGKGKKRSKRNNKREEDKRKRYTKENEKEQMKGKNARGGPQQNTSTENENLEKKTRKQHLLQLNFLKLTKSVRLGKGRGAMRPE